MQVLLVGQSENLPTGIAEFLADRNWSVDTAPDCEAAVRCAKFKSLDAVVLGGASHTPPVARSFLRLLDARRIATLVVGADNSAAGLSDETLIEQVPANISLEEVSQRLSMLTRFQMQLRRMEGELDNMQRIGNRLNQHFREVDEEMRLACRLQQDFLPRDMERVGPLRFGTLYRPATWVSGDLFDIQRLDEKHVGFYIADAVGHGMSAGLLTMYIKRALVMKRIVNSSYELLDPAESLKQLNESLIQHALPRCQFVTALYCKVNLETLVMQYARGGHPYPLLIPRDGSPLELKSPGGLLGLMPDMECPTCEVQLKRGDKIILYTDGIECPFDGVAQETPDGWAGHLNVLTSVADGSAGEFVARLGTRLDHQGGSLGPLDDITVVAMEVTDD